MKNLTDEKIKAKINKLLALSASDNENESRTAMRQALSLMKKHQLKKSDLETSEIETICHTTSYSKCPSWLTMLANGISRVTGVYLVYSGANQNRSGKVELFFTGADGSAERAEYIYETAIRSIDLMVSDWRKGKHPRPSRSACNDYRQGLVIAYIKRVKEVYADVDESVNGASGSALVTVDTRLEEAKQFYLNGLSGNVRLAKSSRALRDSSALHQGIRDGKSVSVNQAVRGNASKTLLLSA